MTTGIIPASFARIFAGSAGGGGGAAGAGAGCAEAEVSTGVFSDLHPVSAPPINTIAENSTHRNRKLILASPSHSLGIVYSETRRLATGKFFRLSLQG
jgi:hypothetical protein